jgi:hypothetical protein
MHVESVDTPALLELRDLVAQRLRAYGAFDGCTAAERRMILAQACLAIWHLTAGKEGRRLYLTHLGPPVDGASSQRVLDTLARLCPDVIAAVQGYVAAWHARFRRDGWHPTQWEGCCEGLNGTLLEVFVTDTRQQVLAAYERNASRLAVLIHRDRWRGLRRWSGTVLKFRHQEMA